MAPRTMGLDIPSDSTPPKFRLSMLQEEVERRQRNDAELSDRIAALEKKVSAANLLQWSVGVLVTVLGIWLTWLTTSQPDRNAESARQIASATAESVLRQHLSDTRQTSLDTAREALRLEDEARQARANPPPLNSAPDRLAARPVSAGR